MSLDSMLIHKADTERATTVADAYGKSKQNYAPLLYDVRCRLIYKTQNRAPDILGEQPITTQYLLLLPRDADIQQGDRVKNVVFEDGAVDAGPYRIAQLLPRRGRALKHISVQLEKAT